MSTNPCIIVHNKPLEVSISADNPNDPRSLIPPAVTLMVVIEAVRYGLPKLLKVPVTVLSVLIVLTKGVVSPIVAVVVLKVDIIAVSAGS